MYERITRIAEQAVTQVSRRSFLGRFGRVAATTAAAVGGLLALPATARAGRRIRRCGPNSSFFCQGLRVGSACAGNGVCKPIDKNDKSDVVDCTCRMKRKGPPRRRR